MFFTTTSFTVPNINYKKPLELARVNNVYSLPPSTNQRPPNMEVSKYCELADEHYFIYQRQGKLSCLTKTSMQTVKCNSDVIPEAVAKPKSPCGRKELIGRRYDVQYDVRTIEFRLSDTPIT